MLKVAILFLVWILLVSSQALVFAQSSERMVDWKTIQGKKDELVVVFPEGESVISEPEFFLGPKMTRVSRKTTTYRYINGVVLVFESYEGNAKNILEALVGKYSEVPSKDEVIDDFRFVEYSMELGKYLQRLQFYQNKSRVYVAKAIFRTSNDPIVEDFFDSITLKSKTGSPSNQTNLPRQIAEKAMANDSSVIYQEDEVDRKPLILFGPKIKNLASSGFITNLADLNVRMKVVLLPSGKVRMVELSGGSQTVRNAYEEAAEGIVFIPAEKDGKPVAVHHVFDTMLAGKPGVIRN